MSASPGDHNRAQRVLQRASVSKSLWGFLDLECLPDVSGCHPNISQMSKESYSREALSNAPVQHQRPARKSDIRKGLGTHAAQAKQKPPFEGGLGGSPKP